jgi:hypothetical protein
MIMRNINGLQQEKQNLHLKLGMDTVSGHFLAKAPRAWQTPNILHAGPPMNRCRGYQFVPSAS